jgi:IBR domain, a half RING-finger domain
MPTSITKFVKALQRPKKPKPKEKGQQPKDVALNDEECLVCLETEQCVSTQKCRHPICVTCLGTYIAVTHGSRMPCPCPSSAICKAKFTIDDIAPFVNDEQIAKIWLEQAALQIEKGLGIYCPNPQCSKPILWNKKAKKKRGAAGKCRNCTQPVCVGCKSAYHFNMRYIPPRFSEMGVDMCLKLFTIQGAPGF